MKEEETFKKYPHKHLLGIEGLSPISINFLLDSSQKFADYLKDTNNNKLDYLQNTLPLVILRSN